jgi:hypothetical protein
MRLFRVGTALVASFVATAAGTSVFAQELTYDYVHKLYPSQASAGTAVGVKGSPARFVVGPFGSVGRQDQGLTAQFAYGYPFVRLGNGGTPDCRLIDGVYPAPVTTWSNRGLTFEETVLAAALPGGKASSADTAALIRLRVRNETITRTTQPLLVFLGSGDPNDRTFRLPGRPSLGYPLTFDEGALKDKDGNVVFYAPSDPKPDYFPIFAGTGYVQSGSGLVQMNTQRQVQAGPAYALQFELGDKDVKLDIDSLDVTHTERLSTPGFDLLLRADNTEPQPILIKVKLNDQDLGVVGQDGLIKATPEAGRFLSAVPTAFRTSLTASSRLAPHSYSRVMTDRFSFEVDFIFFRLVREPKPSSSFRVIFCSTSAALAPW